MSRFERTIGSNEVRANLHELVSEPGLWERITTVGASNSGILEEWNNGIMEEWNNLITIIIPTSLPTGMESSFPAIKSSNTSSFDNIRLTLCFSMVVWKIGHN